MIAFGIFGIIGALQILVLGKVLNPIGHNSFATFEGFERLFALYPIALGCVFIYVGRVTLKLPD